MDHEGAHRGIDPIFCEKANYNKVWGGGYYPSDTMICVISMV